MNMRHCALQDRKTTKRTLPYNRQYVILAIYEVLDKNGAEYKKEGAFSLRPLSLVIQEPNYQ